MIRFRKRPIRISFGSDSWSVPPHAFTIAPNRGPVSASAIKQVLRAVLSLSVVLATEAHAEADKGGVAAEPVSKEAAPPGVIPSSKDPDTPPPKDPDEVLIIGQRYGEAKVGTETEFSEEEIASHGADSIQDLLTRLQPLIGDGEEEPVLLINGQPAGFDRSILAYPAEALDRLAVLKPEAAARYGERSGRRVVNLVLKKQFSSLNADISVGGATAGGQYGGDLSVGRAAINGPTRWNVQARVSYDSALHKSDRDIPRRPGAFDGTGYVSAPGGGEIDPLLSAIAGRPATTAAIPPDAWSRAPLLADFAVTVGESDPIDPNRFETVMPARRSMSVGVGVTRPLGDFSASLSINAGRSTSRATRGLPMASILLPAISPWSPFAGDILLTRPFAGTRALRSDTDSESLGISLTLGGAIGGWQTNLSLSYSRGWSRSFLESGVDVGRVQQLVNGEDPDFNPYGRWDDRLLIANRNRSEGEGVAARLNVKKNLVMLPAGPVVANLSVNAARNHSDNRQSDNLGAPSTRTESTLQRLDGMLTLSVPLSRAGEGEILSLGTISFDLAASAQTMTNSRLRKRYEGDLNWTPIPQLQLRASIGHAETAPSFNQLDDPIITTVNRIFDYSRAEMADVIWITGGNPALRRGTQRNMALAATIRPLNNQAVSLNIAYRRNVAEGGVAGFPELTPVIEAAFPERVTRDADGRLVSIDARAINIAHATDSELSSGLALRFPVKPTATSTTLSFALRHRWRLESELLTHPGVPAIDLLAQSGQSRHSLSFQTTTGKRGWGATLGANWSSASRVTSGTRTLHTKPPVTFNLSMFVEPRHLSQSVKKGSMLDNLKVSLEVQNLFRGYRQVTLGDGSNPPGFSRDEIDPLGRVVRISLRKRF